MVSLINHQTFERGSFPFSGGLGKQSCCISSADGHRSLRILCPFPEKDFLPLFRKCQHMVTDDSHLSYRYRSGTNSHCLAWLKYLLSCQRPKTILSFFLPQQAWTDSPTASSQKVWGLTGFSCQITTARSLFPIHKPQTQSLLPGQAGGSSAKL